MRRSLLSAAAAGFMLIMVTACGGSGSTATAPPAAASQAAAGAHLCNRHGYRSAGCHRELRVHAEHSAVGVGKTVTWTNGDTTDHTVTFDNGPDCGHVAASGGTVTVTFPRPARTHITARFTRR